MVPLLAFHEILPSLMQLRHSPICLFLAATLAACGAVDKVLEGNTPPNARLAVDVPAGGAVSVARGASYQFDVSVTRVGEYSGPVEVIIDNGPSGIEATLGSQVTVGKVTTVAVTLQVSEAMALGSYSMRVLGRASRIPDVARVLNITVLPQPAYDLAVSRQTVTVVTGGIAPLTVSVNRTNFTAPIALSLNGSTGISANFTESPLAGTSTGATIVAASDLAPGTYTVTLRGQADGLPTREVTITVVVIADALQLITEQATTRQGTSVTTPIIINRNGVEDPIRLSASNLPGGVTASFDPNPAAGGTATMTIVVAPAVAAQSYTATVNAVVNGTPIASAELALNVTPSSLALALTPASLAMFQGTSTTTKLTLTRTSLESPVAISIVGLPAGVTASASPSTVTGDESTITITVSDAAVAGDYVVSVLGAPTSWPAGNSRNATLALTVRPVPGTEGNVILDWSRCTAPLWVARQDGEVNSGWLQVMATSGGVYRFSVTQARGGFAYADGAGVTVRYMTGAQLTAAPHDMCPVTPVQGTKTITGSGAHVGAGETFTYSLGGSFATSTTASPSFQLQGVPDGVHDLVAFGSPTITGARGLIRRDVDLPDGESLGSIDLVGTDASAPVRPNVTQSGAFQSGDVLSHAMAYLTTPACTENRLYTSGSTGTVTVMMGVPETIQRPTDFHRITSTIVGTSRTRVFQRMQAKTVILPPLNGTVNITSLTGSYRRLQAVVGGVSSAYNGTAEFRYSTGQKSVTIRASMQWVASATVNLVMPDFSGVSGWQDAFAVPAGGSGAYTFITDGGALTAPLCTEGRATVMSRQFGTF